MPDRRMDEASRVRLAEIQKGYEKLTKRLLIILCVQLLVLLGYGLAFYILFDENAQRADENRDRATENAQLILEIQQERRTNSQRGCEQVNKRHDEAVAEVLKLRDSLPPTPEGKANAEATIQLIDKLAPYTEDCEAYAKSQITVNDEEGRGDANP